MEQIYVPIAVVGLLIILFGLVRLRRVSIQNFVISLAGAILGLLLGALASVPLSQLPQPYGQSMPLIVSLVLTIGFIWLSFAQRQLFVQMAPFLDLTSQKSADAEMPATSKVANSEILVDTSVIIDGRIADIATAGFVPGRLLVPRFVLAELQNIADSEDAMRRSRGRRGLEVLNRLRETSGIEIEIIEQDAPEIKEVDHKLVALARLRPCDVLTTDYNLNRVAQIQGVRVLNINELANAIRPVVIPGEELLVHVVQPGKERGQGVGYLADGTMIVVDSGDKLIGQDILTEVTRVFQTVAGKMIFAVPKNTQPNTGSKSGRGHKNHKNTPDVSDIDAVIAQSKTMPDHTPVMPAADTREPKAHKPRNNSNNQRRQRQESPEDRLIRTAQEAAESTSN